MQVDNSELPQIRYAVLGLCMPDPRKGPMHSPRHRLQYVWVQPCTMALQAAGKVLQQPMAAWLPVSPLAGVSLCHSRTHNRSNPLCQLLCHLSSSLCVQACLLLGIILAPKGIYHCLVAVLCQELQLASHLSICCATFAALPVRRAAQYLLKMLRRASYLSLPEEGCSPLPYSLRPAARNCPGCLFGHHSEECSLPQVGGSPLPSLSSYICMSIELSKVPRLLAEASL